MTVAIPFVAEYLPRIQRLSVLADSQKWTACHIRDGQLVATVGGETVVMPLPHPAIETPDLLASLQSDGSVQSLKLATPVLPEDAVHVDKSHNALMTKEPKWDHAQLAERRASPVRCAECHRTLFEMRDVSTIRGMPSEIWAEMMEYWHCHKPNEEGEGQTASKYGVFRPIEKGLLVGHDYLLVDKSLFPGTACPCGASLGTVYASPSCVKLYKWSLLLGDEPFEPYLHALNTLENTVACTSSRFFLVGQALMWVFAYGISVSTPLGVYRDCLKVLYTEDPAQIARFREGSAPPTEVEFPPVVGEDLLRKLKRTTAALPQSQRKFTFWNVSYLGSPQ